MKQGREKVELGKPKGRIGSEEGGGSIELSQNQWSHLMEPYMVLLYSGCSSEKTNWGYWGFTQDKRTNVPQGGSGGCPGPTGYTNGNVSTAVALGAART